MTTIVIGGHSRKVGKTSVTAGLIRAFPRYPWTAMKVSSHWHSTPPGGDACAIHEERSRFGDTDSSRFLSAGAERSFWVQIREDRIDEAMQRLRPVFESSPFLIIESNCILQYLQPDLFIMVLRYDVDDFKESARENLGRAHALVVVRGDAKTRSLPPWIGFVQETAAGIPWFTTADPHAIPPGLLDLVGTKLPQK